MLAPMIQGVRPLTLRKIELRSASILTANRFTSGTARPNLMAADFSEPKP